MTTNYELRYFSCDGDFLGYFDLFISLDFGRQKNEIGIAELVLPPIYDHDYFSKDNILEIWRYNQATDSLELVGETFWLLRKVETCLDSSGVEETVLTFYDTMHILSRRTIAWTEVNPDPITGYAANYPSSLILPPDLILKRIFYHNFLDVGVTDDLGAGVPDFATFLGITRNTFDITLNNLGVPIDAGVAAVRYTMSMRNCLEAMKDVANSFEARNEREMWFDIVYTPAITSTTLGTLEFMVWLDYRNEDRSGPNGIIFGPEYENLNEVCLLSDWEEEITRVYAIGTMEDLDADGISEYFEVAYAEVTEPTCPYYEIDTIIKYDGNQDDLDSLETKAYAELGRLRKKTILTGNIIQLPGSQLFVDYNWGDLITASWKGVDFISTINKFEITVDQDQESITIPLESVFVRT